MTAEHHPVSMDLYGFFVHDICSAVKSQCWNAVFGTEKCKEAVFSEKIRQPTAFANR